MKIRIWLLAWLLTPVLLIAQRTQTIQGTVIDNSTKQAIPGASVVVTTMSPQKGTITNEDGSFELTEVPVGRHILQVSYLGYNTFNTEGLILNSSRVLVVAIELVEQAFQMDEIIVTAVNNTNAPVNAASVVSTRSFSVEET